ncbi:MAG: hypothetical protein WC391_02440 [Methanoregula sp.]|jgi:DNA-binding helix-hairpin-helix protein with protein kinase domain
MPVSPQTLFYDSKGSRVILGKKIGSGGEGDVFDIPSSHHTLVAKIYHKPLDAQKQEKLRLMVQDCNEDLKTISAWPVDLLRTGHSGPVCGFLMQKITDCEPIHKVYGPSHRKQSFPNADWRFLVRTAKNLSAVFNVIHKYGYIVGDVNEGNILVTRKACVQFIDCDSFQVTHEDKTYYCEVGVAQFTPPEIQSSDNFRMTRTQNHDNFGLAILIFHLLFMGRHPFSGVYQGAQDMPLEKAIAQYRFAFGKNAHLKSIVPPPDSVDLSIVPGEIRGLFEQAFTETGSEPDGRPSANDWWNALDFLEQRIRYCADESVHTYYSGLSSCPWCRLENASGILLFLSSDNISKIDLNAEWNKVLAIQPPGPIPAISPKMYRFLPTPLPDNLKKALTFSKIRKIVAIALVVGGLLMVLETIGRDYLVLIGAFILAGALFFYPGKETAERKQRKTRFMNARYAWEMWHKKWQKEAGDDAFIAQLNHLTHAKKQYETIENEYKRALALLQQSAKEQQQKKYLEQCFIDNEQFTSVNAQRKAALRSFGIETALDISRQKLTGIPGLGKPEGDELIAWRKRLEQKFKMDPSKGTDSDDIQALVHTFQPRIRPVERDLQAGRENLHQIQQTIINNRIRFQPAVEKSAKSLAQAQADLRIFFW